MSTHQTTYLTRLLVALEYDSNVDPAIEWSRVLAAALHLPVSFLTVIDPRQLPDDVTPQQAEAISRDWLRLVQADSRLVNVDLRTDTFTGNPSELLPEVCARHPGSILVLFAGRAGHDGWPPALGIELDQLVRDVMILYMVIPADARVPDRIHSVVVGNDRSRLAQDVLNTARTVAHSLDVTVIAVEAVEPGEVEDSAFLNFEPVITDRIIRARGYASRLLLTAARTRGASIIAVGSHGAGAAESHLMGRTAEWLSRNADRPILIVPEAR